MEMLERYVEQACQRATMLESKRRQIEQDQSDLSIARIKHPHPMLERIGSELQDRSAVATVRAVEETMRCKDLTDMLRQIKRT